MPIRLTVLVSFHLYLLILVYFRHTQHRVVLWGIHFSFNISRRMRRSLKWLVKTHGNLMHFDRGWKIEAGCIGQGFRKKDWEYELACVTCLQDVM